MPIRSLETVRVPEVPNLCLVRIIDDDGVAGLGEAFFGATTVESYLHDIAAPILFELDDPSPEAAAAALSPYVGFQGGGIELRGNGAIDLAIWDLLGRRTGLPVARLLGGPVRPDAPVYNTCAGSGYVGESTRQQSSNWGIERAGRYEDLAAFLHRPGELSRELLDEGYTGMKIWPFDTAAERSRGTGISQQDLAAGLRIVEAVRDEVGMDLNLMIELHGLWSRTAAATILRALEEFTPYWAEDPVRSDQTASLADLRSGTSIPIATGETAVGRRGFLPLLTADAVDIVTVDVQWTGGLTEARKVASLADAFGLTVAPHDCHGPITLAACAHLTMSQPNAVVQEVARAFLHSWYPLVVDGLPAVANGRITLADAPGLGVELAEGLLERPGVTRRVSER